MDKIQVWPGVIDHIAIEDTSYTRNGVTIEGEMYKFYIKKGTLLSFERPYINVAFKGTHDAVIDLYKDFPTTEVDGIKTISGKDIKEKDEELLYLYTKNALNPKEDGDIEKRLGWIFGNIPLSDGKQEWAQIREGKLRLTNTGKPIVQTHLNVAVQAMYLGKEQGWQPLNSGNSLLDALRVEMEDQKRRSWIPFNVNVEQDEEAEDQSEADSGPEEDQEA